MIEQFPFGSTIHDDVLGPGGIITVQELFDVISTASEEDPREGRLHPPVHFRSIFISDAHMGSLSSCTADLAQFLIHTVGTEYIYLVGDMFEEHLPRRIVSAAEELFLQKLMRAARKGARVIGIPGNHDTFLRKYAKALRIHNFMILNEAAHRTIDDRYFLVIHGDQFDALLRWPWLSILGTRVYEILCKLSVATTRWRQIRWFDRVLTAIGISRDWSLSHHIKSQSDQMAYSTNANYIRTMANYLFARNTEIARRINAGLWGAPQKFFTGLIGGHSHIADCKRFVSPLDHTGYAPIGPREVLYFNTGHWTGRPRTVIAPADEGWRSRLKNPTCTAVVEYPDGRMGHVQWVPGRGIVPLTRYEESSLGAVDIDGNQPLAPAAQRATGTGRLSRPKITARIGRWIADSVATQR